MRLRDYFSVAGEETAKELLLQSRLPMIEIALKCGFADRACFIRRFHKLLNTRPAGGEKREKILERRVTSLPATAQMTGEGRTQGFR
jgi:AraC-like DNA-binding protein